MASFVGKYIINEFVNVIVHPIDGIDYESPHENSLIDAKVEKKVKEIISTLKSSHSKFIDNDFGPNENDEYGEKSLYGNGKPDPAGSKYPSADSLRWERPQYEDKKFQTNEEENSSTNEEDEDEDDDFSDAGYSGNEEAKIWCTKGELFVEGGSSGDVIQGQLGDCWFLSALAVLGADTKLEECFWRRDDFQEYGLYVLRFFKDCNIVFVVIDDRLPVKSKDGRLIFASCKNSNELWVPFIEKAYAKLHGCYKSLIGGYTHYGLADLTGKCPRQLVMREGYLGYSESYSPEEIWDILKRYLSWKSLMGCSIQSNPKEKNKVEADAGNGLHMGHAYSFLAADEITITDLDGNPSKLKLVKLRNPWGRGEWEGAFNDRSEERDIYTAEINRVFNETVNKAERVEANFNDGTFFMPFIDWMKYFTSLFVAINFPNTWCGRRTQGKWSAEQGGNRQMGTWITNPKYKFKLEGDNKSEDSQEEYRQVFIGIYIKDPRMTLGYDYFKDPLYATPLTFDIVCEKDVDNADFKKRENIPFGFKSNPGSAKSIKSIVTMKQPPYNFGTTQIEVFLKVGVEYYIVPSLYKRNQGGDFFLVIYANCKSFFLENSTSLMQHELQKPMIVGAPSVKNDIQQTKPLKMSKAQFYEKKELLRERILSETKRLNLSIGQLSSLFQDVMKSNLSLSRMDFKRRMIDIGYNLSDFPDDDLIVLDENNDDSISPQEFMKFYEDGMKFYESVSTTTSKNGVVAIPQAVVEKPVDDLLLKGLIDLNGEIKVMVYNGRGIQQPTTWFTKVQSNMSDESIGIPSSNFLVQYVSLLYDPKEAYLLRKQSAEKKKYKWIEEKKISIYDVGNCQNKKNDEISLHLESGENASPRSPVKLNNKSGWFSATTREIDSMRPKTPHTVNEKENGSLVSALSQIQLDHINSASNKAVNLHTGNEFRKGEINRTKSLFLLKSANKKVKSAAGIDNSVVVADSIMLLKKSVKSNSSDGKVANKQSYRRISDDSDTQAYLNYFVEQNSDVPIRQNSIESERIDREPNSSSQFRNDPLSSGKERLDFWDEILNRVIVIVLSRATIVLNSAQEIEPSPTLSLDKTGNTYKQYLSYKRKSFSLSYSQVQTLITLSQNRPNSVAPSPSTAANVSLSKRRGHIPTPMSQRKIVATGTASIGGGGQYSRHSNANKQLSTTLLTDKLSAIQPEKQYEEIYRRILNVPVITQEDIAGERQDDSRRRSDCISYLRVLFQSYDKNRNGYLSKDDFGLALQQLLTPTNNSQNGNSLIKQDMEILYRRFSYSTEKDGNLTETKVVKDLNVDWRDFVSFFGTHIVATGDKNHVYGDSMFSKILQIKAKIPVIIKYLKDEKHTSIDQLIHKYGKRIWKEGPLPTSITTKILDDPTLPDQIIFQSLSLNQANRNHQILTSLGLTFSIEEMARISRIFQYDVMRFMEFMKVHNIIETQLQEHLTTIDIELANELSIRGSMPIYRPCTYQASAMGKYGATKGVNDRSDTNNFSCTIDGSEKIWHAFATSVNANVGYDTVLQYCLDIVQHSSLFNGAKIDRADITTNLSPSGGNSNSKSLKIKGISVSLLLGIILDTVFYSPWNRCGGGTLKNSKDAAYVDTNAIETVDGLSFSGWDAFVRYTNLLNMEKTLYYLYLQQENLHRNSINLLTHVYISQSQDELVIVAEDPLAGEVYTHILKDHSVMTKFNANLANNVNTNVLPNDSNSFKSLPYGNKLQEMFKELVSYTDLIQQYDPVRRILGVRESQLFNADSLMLYNPFDTPAEDQAISALLSRYKLLTKHSSSSNGINSFSRELRLGEDERIIKHLKSTLDSIASSLPFFFLLNDLILLFEVDFFSVSGEDHENNRETNSSTSHGNLKCLNGSKHFSIRHFVFDSLRKHQSFVNYVTSIQSSLTIVISTYNHSYRECFSWFEMLSHLLQYRNPFVTLRLLPNFISPEKYLYEKEDVNGAFQGDDSEDDNENSDETDRSGNNNGSLIRRKPVHNQSSVDYDGLPHPQWNEDFSFTYQSSKLTTCPILSTEVIKMQIEQKWMYVVVILRQGVRNRNKMFRQLNATLIEPKKYEIKEKFYFLTIYDPRSATEYQCGIDPKHKLYNKLYFHKLPDYTDSKKMNNAVSLENGGSMLSNDEIQKLMELLEDCSEQNMLILGPAITPRIELQVYNYQNEKNVILLGQSQVSISSVLSGSGVGEKSWVTLTLPIDMSKTSSNEGSVSRNSQISAPIVPVGEIQVELRFRRSLELENTNIATKPATQKKLSNSKPTDPKVLQNMDATSIPLVIPQSDEEAKTEAKTVEFDEKDTLIKALQQEVVKLKDQLNIVSSSKAVIQTKEIIKDASIDKDQNLSVELSKMQDLNKTLKQQLISMENDFSTGKKVQETLKDQLEKLRKVQDEWNLKEREYDSRLSDLQTQINYQKAENELLATKTLAVSKVEKSNSHSFALLDIVPTTSDVMKVVQSIVKIFLNRYESRNASKTASQFVVSGVLDGFQRLCYSFANAEGLISVKDVSTIFHEVMIEVSIEDVGKIAQTVGVNSKHLLQVKHLLDLFNSELAQSFKTLKNSLRQSADNLQLPVAPARSSQSELKSPHPTNDLIKQTAKDEIIGVETVNDDGAEKKLSSKVRPKSASLVADTPTNHVNNPNRTIGPVTNVTNTTNVGKDRKAQTQPVRSQSANMNSNTAQAAHAVPAQELNLTATVDWSKKPLPENWERKYHKPSKRFVYIDHANKKTQWYHPDDLAGLKGNDSDNSKTEKN